MAVSLGTSVINVSAPAHSFDTYIFYDSASTGTQTLKPEASFQSPLPVKIIRSRNSITLVPRGLVFSAGIMRLDGRVEAVFSTNSGKSLTIRTDAMAPGVYFIKGMIDGKVFMAPLPVRD